MMAVLDMEVAVMKIELKTSMRVEDIAQYIPMQEHTAPVVANTETNTIFYYRKCGQNVLDQYTKKPFFIFLADPFRVTGSSKVPKDQFILKVRFKETRKKNSYVLVECLQ